MAQEDSLETEVRLLRQELVAWILTEIRAGALADGTRAPLAEDLVAVVREGLGQAVRDAAGSLDRARALAFSEQLQGALQTESGETQRQIHEAMATIEARLDERLERMALATNRLADTAPAASAADPQVARQLRDLRQGLQDIAKLLVAREGAPVRLLEESATDAESVGPANAPADPIDRALGGPGRSRWLLSGVGLVVGALVGAGLLFLVTPKPPPPIVPDTATADEAHAVAQAMTERQATPAAKADANAVAAAGAEVAEAVSQAATAASPEAAAAAHKKAVGALTRLRDALPEHAPPAAPGAGRQGSR